MFTKVGLSLSLKEGFLTVDSYLAFYRKNDNYCKKNRQSNWQYIVYSRAREGDSVTDLIDWKPKQIETILL